MLMSLLLGSAMATTITVEADESGQYTSISAAVSAAAHGDEIHVGEGTWYEYLSMGTKNLTIVGSGSAVTTLDASGLSDNAIRGVGVVTIEGMTITNAGQRGLLVDAGGDFSLHDVLMTTLGSVNTYGSAIWANEATISLSDSVVTDSEAATGQIYLEGSTLTATDFELSNSTATTAGGIFASFSTVYLDNCTLQGLTAFDGNGGALYLASSSLEAVDSHFIENLTVGVSDITTGGAIYGLNSDLHFIGGSISRNTLDFYDYLSYYGGGLYLLSSTAQFDSTEMMANAAFYGGAIWARDSDLIFNGAYFQDNYAYYGAAIYSTDDSAIGVANSITDNNSTWTSNAAYYDGGALYTNYSQNLTLNGSAFYGNYATYGSGGAMIAYYGAGTFSDVTFEDNYAYGDAGAVYLYAPEVETSFMDCTFAGNESDWGAGGAIVAYYAEMLVQSSSFSNNTARYNGGAIHNGYSYGLEILDSNFWANQTPEGGGGAVKSNYPSQGAKMRIERVLFSGNTARSDGGAISSSNENLQMTGNEFLDNEAGLSGMGGAVSIRSSVMVRANNNLFFANTATYGGAVYASESLSIYQDWNNNIFMENSADIGGAAVWSTMPALTFTNNTLVGNSAIDEGNVFSLVEAPITMTNNLVAHTVGDGGALYAYDEYSAKNSQFSHNAFYDNGTLVSGTLTTAAVVDKTTLQDIDPVFTAYTADHDESNDNLVLLRDSPLVDAGDPKVLDPDGSISDIGAWGGPDVLVEDADKDGYDNWIDCDDGDPNAHPDGTEIFYDGVNSDCLSGSDYDADGDGKDAVEYGGDDCDDSDSTRYQDCGDTDEVVDTGMGNSKPPLEDSGSGESCGCQQTTPVSPWSLWFYTAISIIIVWPRRQFTL